MGEMKPQGEGALSSYSMPAAASQVWQESLVYQSISTDSLLCMEAIPSSGRSLLIVSSRKLLALAFQIKNNANPILFQLLYRSTLFSV